MTYETLGGDTPDFVVGQGSGFIDDAHSLPPGYEAAGYSDTAPGIAPDLDIENPEGPPATGPEREAPVAVDEAIIVRAAAQRDRPTTPEPITDALEDVEAEVADPDEVGPAIDVVTGPDNRLPTPGVHRGGEEVVRRGGDQGVEDQSSRANNTEITTPALSDDQPIVVEGISDEQSLQAPVVVRTDRAEASTDDPHRTEPSDDAESSDDHSEDGKESDDEPAEAGGGGDEIEKKLDDLLINTVQTEATMRAARAATRNGRLGTTGPGDVIAAAVEGMYTRFGIDPGALAAVQNFQAYFCRAVYRTATDLARYQARRPEQLALDADHMDTPAPHRADPADNANLANFVTRQGIRGLPDLQREIIARQYYLDLTSAEIAKVLGITVPQVKYYTRQAMTGLRSALSDMDLDRTE
jgi:RNA polymerase sigma factor (sigma-70 family)